MWQSYLYYSQGLIQNLAFYADNLPSTHPVEIEVEKPFEIQVLFDDSIIYNKG